MKTKYYFFIFMLFIACESTDLQSQEAHSTQAKHISNYDLPQKLTWCGEEVPLNDPEIRERAEREFYLLMQQPGQVILYLKRAGRWFPLFERIIKESNMPDDLKYLAVAESALYQATSSKGAIGFWQFMPGTAKEYGLRVDDLVDERRSPEQSTYAAMRYLQDGYKSSGSWMLTAGGYNMGHYGIKKAMNFQLNSESYFDLFLNEETSRFVFRIAIIKEIMVNHKKYGFELTEDDFYKPHDAVEIEWTTSIENLAVWANVHGTTYKDVKLLNPWILKRELKNPASGKPYKILVPKN